MYKKLFLSKRLQSASNFPKEIWLIITIIVLATLRCAILPYSPLPFAMDEAASGAHIRSMVLNGTNAHGQAWPLFSSALGGGYTTPVYLYPASVWAFFFGSGENSLRYFSEFSTIIAILLMAYGVRLWFDKRLALITACTGLALPWGWLQGSLAWDPALVPLFVSIAFVSFSLVFFGRTTRIKSIALIIFPISILALAYLYPPLRVTALLLFIAAYCAFYRKKFINNWGISATVLGLLLLSLPLIGFLNNPDALSRSKEVLVFYHTSFPLAVVSIVANILQLLNPAFLLFWGDSNLRHSTGFQGMLGWAALPALIGIAGLVTGAIKKKKVEDLFIFSVGLFGIFAGVLGSALTYEGQPHSLRATAAWPFMLIILALGWRWIFNQKNKLLTYASITVFILGTSFYLYDYAFSFPARSSNAFDNTLYENALHHADPSFPGIASKYYELRR